MPPLADIIINFMFVLAFGVAFFAIYYDDDGLDCGMQLEDDQKWLATKKSEVQSAQAEYLRAKQKFEEALKAVKEAQEAHACLEARAREGAGEGAESASRSRGRRAREGRGAERRGGGSAVRRHD